MIDFRRWLSLKLISLALRARPQADDSDKSFARSIADLCRVEAAHAWVALQKSYRA